MRQAVARGGQLPAADIIRRTPPMSNADNFVSASVRGGLRLGGHWRTPADSESVCGGKLSAMANAVSLAETSSVQVIYSNNL